jgi:hypothetical protein
MTINDVGEEDEEEEEDTMVNQHSQVLILLCE